MLLPALALSALPTSFEEVAGVGVTAAGVTGAGVTGAEERGAWLEFAEVGTGVPSSDVTEDEGVFEVVGDSGWTFIPLISETEVFGPFEVEPLVFPKGGKDPDGSEGLTLLALGAGLFSPLEVDSLGFP
jgi:hypothetical protein